MLHLREERIRELACLIASAMPPRKIVFSQSEKPVRQITRHYYLRRINWLAESYGLKWQIDQATLGARLDSLADDELDSLLRDMEHGRRCCVEGNSFDEAGLVRTLDQLQEMRATG